MVYALFRLFFSRTPYRFIILIVVSFIVLPPFISGTIYYYELEWVGAAFFGMWSLVYLVILVYYIGYRLIGKLLNNRFFLYFSFALSLTSVSLAYISYYLIRMIYALSGAIPMFYLPSGYNYYPWLYFNYFASFLYSLATCLIFLVSIDIEAYRRGFKDKEEKYKLFVGGPKAYTLKFFGLWFLIFGVVIGLLPLLYMVDCFRGKEKPFIPLDDLVPFVLKFSSLFLIVVSIWGMYHAYTRIVRNKYYTYLAKSREEMRVA